MKIMRAILIDNFEDGTFETYWEDSVTGGNADVYLQKGTFVKDGQCSLRFEINLDAGAYGFAQKMWTSPQIDLSDYDRIYFWVHASAVGELRVKIRNNGSWGSDSAVSDDTVADEWVLLYWTCAGTRDQIDGFEFQLNASEFGTGAETFYFDTIVAVRTDTDHQFDFSTVHERTLVKGLRTNLIAEEIPGREGGIIQSRGISGRTRGLAGDFKTLAEKQSFEDVMRCGDNLYFLTGLGGLHGIVVRVGSKDVNWLAGITTIYPFHIQFSEHLGSSL